MNNRVLIASFGSGSSNAFALNKALSEHNIEYEIEESTELDDAQSFHITHFNVNQNQVQVATEIVTEISSKQEEFISYAPFKKRAYRIAMIPLVILILLYIFYLLKYEFLYK